MDPYAIIRSVEVYVKMGQRSQVTERSAITASLIQFISLVV